MTQISPYDEEPIKVPRFEEAAGFYTSEQRSRLMSKIKGKNTQPELFIRRVMWEQHISFRIHVKDLPGKPDIAKKKYTVAIFIEGEYWQCKDWEETKSKIKNNKEL